MVLHRSGFTAHMHQTDGHAAGDGDFQRSRQAQRPYIVDQPGADLDRRAHNLGFAGID